ncbi:MAG TPA: hypothetical protein VF422_04365 [Dokdonella sp.]
MKRSLPFLASAALVVLLIPAAQAQTPAPLTDNVMPLVQGNLFSSAYLERMKRDASSPARSANVRARAEAGELVVAFDPIVSRDVREDYIAAIERSSGAQAARGLERYYETHDVHDQLREAIGPYGLRGDDLGDVTTAWLVVMWMIANDAPLPTAAIVQGVRDQTRFALLARGGLPEDGAERQRQLEALAYQTVTLIRARESAQASGNQAFLDQLADSAQSTMRDRHLDLRAMALTEDGLVRR